MICSICSLLCDSDNLDEIQCIKRSAALARLDSIRGAVEGPLDTNVNSAARLKATNERLVESASLLKSAKRILITGRIASVATARSAVAFAKSHNATIDCAESGHVFKNILAIQRGGIYSVSLAEAREHTDLFLVIGNDSMQVAIPRMPLALSNGKPRSQTVLLLGDFGTAAAEQWHKAGFDTWTVPCDLENVPNALAKWFQWSEGMPRDGVDESSGVGPLFARLRQAMYTTVVWSAESLQMEQADLWVERLLQWVAGRNEKNRCAALPWLSLDGTFQQVCTWLTGFPGRIDFRNGVPDYDPHKYSYQQWIERTPDANCNESVIVLIDETLAPGDFLKPLEIQAAEGYSVIKLTARSEHFPTAVAGVETIDDMFRADQTVLARVLPSCERRSWVRPASDYLERLSK